MHIQEKGQMKAVWAAFAALLLCVMSLSVRLEAASAVPSQEEQKVIQQNLNEAFNAYVSQDFSKALSHFQKVLQIDPYDAAALKGVKLCRKNLRKSASDRIKEEEQRLKLTKKLVREEKWLDAIDNLKDIANHQYLQSEALKLLSEVEMILRKKISQSIVGSGDYLAYQGILYYMNRRYGDALRVWKEAEQMSSENFKVTVYIQRVEQFYQETAQADAETHRKQAKAAFEAGNIELSLEQWRKVLEINSKDEQAPLEIAKLGALINKKNNQGKIGEIYDLGLSLYQQEKYSESLVEWKKILEIDPANEVALDYAAKIEKLGAQGKAAVSSSTAKPQAVRDTVVATSAVSANADKETAPPASTAPMPAPQANFDAGIKFYNDGNFTKAVDFFNRAFTDNPDDKLAKEWLDRVVQEQGAKADQHYQQGLLSYSLGNVEEAIQEWQKTLEVYPNHLPAKRALIKVGSGQ